MSVLPANGLCRCARLRSIAAGPSALAHANRAMAALKAGDAAAAEADCGAALELDGSYLKAWQRRAAARRALGRPLEAIDDLEAALRWVCCATWILTGSCWRRRGLAGPAARGD